MASNFAERREKFQKLILLRAAYAPAVRETLDALHDSLSASDCLASVEVLTNAREVLHHWAGGGAMYGFPQLSKEALRLEQVVVRWLQPDEAVDALDWQSWIADLQALHHTLEHQDPLVPWTGCEEPTPHANHGSG